MTPRNNPYSFTKVFKERFEERLNEAFTEDNQAYILAQISLGTPHRKIDNKGRYSEYFTFIINEKLVTIVCDQISHKIITLILELHERKQYL